MITGLYKGLFVGILFCQNLFGGLGGLILFKIVYKGIPTLFERPPFFHLKAGLVGVFSYSKKEG